MRLRIRRFAVIAVMGVAVALLLFTLFGDPPKPQPEPQPEPEVPGLAEVDAAAEGIEPEPAWQPPPRPVVEAQPGGARIPVDEQGRVRIVPVYESFRMARTADEAVQYVHDLRAMGENQLATDLEAEVFRECDGIAEVEPRHERTRWAHEMLVEFCADYTPTIPVDDLQLGMIMGLRATMAEVLTEEYSDPDSSRGIDELADTIANAEAPAELRAVSQFLGEIYGEQRHRVLPLGQDPQTGNMNLLKVQQAALKMYECDRFGGCRPYDPATLSNCANSGLCERGWDLYTYYQQNLSPLEFEQAQRVRQFLHARGMGR